MIDSLYDQVLMELLAEQVADNRIVKAIKDRRVVKIFYADPSDDVEDGYRDCEIYAFGINKAGNKVIRCWIREGSNSKSFPPGSPPSDRLTHKPGWRVFRLDRIQNMKNTIQTFDDTIQHINANRPKYNPNDKDMNLIISLNPRKSTNDTKNDNISI